MRLPNLLAGAMAVALPLAGHAAGVPPSQDSYAVNLGVPPAVPQAVRGQVPFWIDTSNGSVNTFGLPRPVSDQSPLPVTAVPAGGVGLDASGAQPAALAVLVSFAVSSPGAYYVQNQSAATLQIIFDDGSGNALSVQLLAPGAGANAQGGDTAPAMSWFTGRIRVAGPPGSQFMARHN